MTEYSLCESMISFANASQFGNNIKILVRSKIDDPKNPTVDRKQSGDYLISTAKYVLDFTQSKVGATFKCVKFGNYQNDAYNVGGGI